MPMGKLDLTDEDREILEKLVNGGDNKDIDNYKL